MAIKTATLAALLLLCASAQLAAQAADPGASAAATVEAATIEDAPAEPQGNSSSFTLDAEGKPVFTQVIRWQADPNALEYELELKDEAGSQLLDERGEATEKELQLSPGLYSYRITTYDLLGSPAAQTDWVELAIVKAEQPVFGSVSPTAIYMDDLDTRITITGEKLLEDGKVEMFSQGGEPLEGRVVERKGEEEIVVVFPDEAYEPGEYTIYFENPGGLSAQTENPLVIRFQRPVDFAISLGYAPFAPLGDSWASSVWSDPVYPIGAAAGISLYFIKRRWGFVGLEAGAEWRRLYGGQETASLTSDYLLCGANVLYKYRITRSLHAVARLGGGLAWSNHVFDYEGSAGPTTTSSDPFFRAGAALQYFLPIKLYGEIGADWTCLFLYNHSLNGISPRLSVGCQFF